MVSAKLLGHEWEEKKKKKKKKTKDLRRLKFDKYYVSEFDYILTSEIFQTS